MKIVGRIVPKDDESTVLIEFPVPFDGAPRFSYSFEMAVPGGAAVEPVATFCAVHGYKIDEHDQVAGAHVMTGVVGGRILDVWPMWFHYEFEGAAAWPTP